MTFELSRTDLDLLLAALDSHVSWQLSDPHYRNDGDVLEPGADDPDQTAEIGVCYDLINRLSTTS